MRCWHKLGVAATLSLGWCLHACQKLTGYSTSLAPAICKFLLCLAIWQHGTNCLIKRPDRAAIWRGGEKFASMTHLPGGGCKLLKRSAGHVFRSRAVPRCQGCSTCPPIRAPGQWAVSFRWACRQPGEGIMSSLRTSTAGLGGLQQARFMAAVSTVASGGCQRSRAC